MSKQKNELRGLPLLPLRGLTAFPGMLLTFDIERPISIAALNFAMGSDQLIFLVTQKDMAKDVPTKDDLYNVGTVCRVRQQLRQTNGSAIRVMVEGLYRAKIDQIITETPSFYAEVSKLSDKPDRITDAKKEALLRACVNMFEDYVHMNETAAPEIILNIIASTDPSYVADFIANNIHIKYQDKQLLLEELRPYKRLNMICTALNKELSVLSFEQELNGLTNDQLYKNQKDYYLREQLKVIQKELGDTEDSIDEISEYRKKIHDLNLQDKEIEQKLLKEVANLAKQPYTSSEGSVIRNYLDVCLSLPWNKSTKETVDLSKAKKCLDDDHFGLEKVKERVIEYLAVKKLNPQNNGGLICLVGPPGTGKTSIAMSIARATNRNLVRISLGGVHDEAEIRGHRKTYVGAMPGRIINGLINAKSSNPVMVLDEIDKLGSDYKGDPSAALLEALDSEQNSTFRDNFIEIPWDLSKVFFITTANTTDTIPRALLDRMEVIELTSYTDEEKVQIAKKYLVPKQRTKHGLKSNQLKISDSMIRTLITKYTRESGVRNLERRIAAVCRKAAASIAEDKCKTFVLNSSNLEDVLGCVRYKNPGVVTKPEVGLVHGLAWTQVGGEVLDVEVAVVDGTGKLELTGNLGDVMKESAKAAVTYIRSRSSILGIDPSFYSNKDIHIHFPEGAIPKDGPSAGITICVALISALTGIPVRSDVAMTGEISLRGKIMAIGGLKEKTMAAYRNGIKTVIIPEDNEHDLKEIDQTVRKNIEFITTNHVDKILEFVLTEKPKKNNKIIPELSKSKNDNSLRQ